MCIVPFMERFMVNPRLPHNVQQAVRDATLRLAGAGRPRTAWRVLGRTLLNGALTFLAGLGLSGAVAFFPVYPWAAAVPALLSVIVGAYCGARCVAAAAEIPDAFGSQRAHRILDQDPGAVIDLARDLDRQARQTWAPLATAVRAADLSAPYVDDIEARVVLLDELWEIAEELAGQSRLRRLRGARLVIEPGLQERQLAGSVSSTQRRVRSLLAWFRQQAEIAEISRADWVRQHADLYNDLEAATVRDDRAIAHLDCMTADSRERARALRHGLREPRQFARHPAAGQVAGQLPQAASGALGSAEIGRAHAGGRQPPMPELDLELGP